MSNKQHRLTVQAQKPGFQLITQEVIDHITPLPQTGLLHLFIQHTSAGLCINENADPSVRYDLQSFFNKLIPFNTPYFTHTAEGADDMPAHIKSILTGNQITIPINLGKLALGTWQGIYLCEFRDLCPPRRIIATIQD